MQHTNAPTKGRLIAIAGGVLLIGIGLSGLISNWDLSTAFLA